MDTTKQSVIKDLKTVGYNASMVSVSYKDSTIKATIRKPHVSYTKVCVILERYEHLRRCEISGDPLLGGNTYIEIEIAAPVREIWKQKYLAELNSLKNKIDIMEDGTGLSTESDFILWKEGHGYLVTKNNWDFRSYTGPVFDDVAIEMFIYEEVRTNKYALGEKAPENNIIAGEVNKSATC